MVGYFLNSIKESWTYLTTSIYDKPIAATIGAVLGGLCGQLYQAFPIELPVVVSIAALVFIDTRTGIRAAKKRGEEIVSHITRKRLCNKLPAYAEMYIAGLAAKTIHPESGAVIYGLLMGTLVSVEIWSILENLYDSGEIPVNPNKVGVFAAFKKIASFKQNNNDHIED